MNILMLDLEGVLIKSARYEVAEHKTQVNKVMIHNLRPYAKEFLDFCEEKFNTIWMNTCVDKRRTYQILRGLGREGFGRKYRYWDWRSGDNPGGWKTIGYEKFHGNVLIHIEDGISEGEEEHLMELGMLYIPVRSYNPSIDNNIKDRELLYTIDTLVGALSILRNP
jgi:hypothetical protein